MFSVHPHGCAPIVIVVGVVIGVVFGFAFGVAVRSPFLEMKPPDRFLWIHRPWCHHDFIAFGVVVEGGSLVGVASASGWY
ncbi:hypothetical protein C2G38_2214359 [Gigaspora rosea]|uniref:Uncharacterized protein n=1 Tax=Gigaspora rosea TaxID=44941 RepID=A0A397UBC3_9GLOM|nr:hypothetical protein C2G38_2214359 [Gigaspora rosea]